MFGGRKTQPSHTQREVPPILVCFWEEDGVWNGRTVHLPVAVFGETFEEARANLSDAITSHIQSLEDAGKIDDVLAHLREHAKEHLRLDELKPNSFAGRIPVPELACV